jgi:hypothetical protein
MPSWNCGFSGCLLFCYFNDWKSISGVSAYHKGNNNHWFINDIDEEVEDRDAGGEIYYYNYAYTFKTTDGRIIKSFQQTSGPDSQEDFDLSKPTPIDIVYLQSNPAINKIKDTLSESLFELLWRKIALGLVLLIGFSSFGFILIRNGIKEFVEKNKSNYKT